MVVELSDYIAAGSLLVSIIAVITSVVSGKKVKALDLQLKEKELEVHKENELELKKADVEVSMHERSGNKLNALRFYNKGKAPAMNVTFEIVSDKKDNDISLNMSNDYLPFPKLLPYQNFEIPYYDCGSKPYHTFLITWDDEFGKGRSKEMVIEL